MVVENLMPDQKAANTLTDRPGINCRSVTMPIQKKGTDSANTSAKNVSGNLFGWPMADGKRCNDTLQI